MLTVCMALQVGEDLIDAQQVQNVYGAPGAGLFQPVDFRIPVGPIFNFVSGELQCPVGTSY